MAAMKPHGLKRYDFPDRNLKPHNPTAREWIERAKETLGARTREEDDTQLIDAYDDLCHALEELDK